VALNYAPPTGWFSGRMDVSLRNERERYFLHRDICPDAKGDFCLLADAGRFVHSAPVGFVSRRCCPQKPLRTFAKNNRALAKRYDEWMLAMHYAKDTQSAYRKVIRMFIDFLGEKSAVTVTHWDIRKYIAQISENGASLDLTYRHLGVVRLFYDFLNLGGVVSYVAPRLVKLRKPVQNPGRTLSETQVQLLISATKTLRERALVEFLYGTGCRLREVRYLKVDDLNLFGRTALVSGKFGKIRSVLLTKSSVEALSAYVGERKAGYVFQQDMPVQRGCVAKRGNYWVGLWIDYKKSNHARNAAVLGRMDLVSYELAKEKFQALVSEAALERPKVDRPLSQMAIQTLLRHIGERVGLRDVGPHMFRRSFATHLYDHGASLEIIQALMGHVYLQTTRTYTRLSVGRIAKSFDRHHPRKNMHD
jgi:integrase/recombinase XerD